jgi:hypothetical protein
MTSDRCRLLQHKGGRWARCWESQGAKARRILNQFAKLHNERIRQVHTVFSVFLGPVVVNLLFKLCDSVVRSYEELLLGPIS